MPERKDVINPILLGATKLGGRLFRNNSGIAFHRDGSYVRYGVGSPGAPDILGWVPRLIVPEDVGQTLALFTAIEAKTGDQRPTKDQEQFLRVVKQAGGLAFWGRDPQEILAKIKEATGC
jgi:hypothetical protein